MIYAAWGSTLYIYVHNYIYTHTVNSLVGLLDICLNIYKYKYRFKQVLCAFRWHWLFGPGGFWRCLRLTDPHLHDFKTPIKLKNICSAQFHIKLRLKQANHRPKPQLWFLLKQVKMCPKIGDHQWVVHHFPNCLMATTGAVGYPTFFQRGGQGASNLDTARSAASAGKPAVHGVRLGFWTVGRVRSMETVGLKDPNIWDIRLLGF
jgi:hypothetical protein